MIARIISPSSSSLQHRLPTVMLCRCKLLDGMPSERGEDMSIAQFKPKMREIRLDTEDFEERFAEYDITSEFTGIILTLVAVEGNVRYTSYVTATYAEILRKQKEAIA